MSSVVAADGVADVVAKVIVPAAPDVDRAGTFPQQGIAALAQAGALGRLSATDVGGGGQDLRGAAEVVETLAGACGSTAMVVLMHYAAVAVDRGARPARRARGDRRGRPPDDAGVLRGRLAAATSGRRRAPPSGRTATRPARRPEELGDRGGRGRQLRLVEPAARGGRADDAVAGPATHRGLRDRRHVRRARPARQRVDARVTADGVRDRRDGDARRRRRGPRHRADRGAAHGSWC